MLTLRRTGTAGALGVTTGLLGSAGPVVAGGAAVAGGLLSLTAPATLPGIDEGLLDGGVAIVGQALAGTAIWLALVGLVGVGAVVVIDAAAHKGIAL